MACLVGGLCVAISATAQRPPNSVDNGCGSVFCDHPHHNPPALLQGVQSANIPHILASAGAVLVSVVLDGHFEAVPAHVEHRHCPVMHDHRYLSFRSWQSSPDYQQSQPGLLGRCCARIEQRQHLSQPLQTARAVVSLGQQQHIFGGKPRGAHQCVESRDTLSAGDLPCQVECRPRGARHGEACNVSDFVVRQPDIAGQYALGGMLIAPDQLDRLFVVDPIRAVQRRCSQPSEDAASPGP